MLKQTYSGPVRWIIIDDGQDAQEITFNRENWSLVVVRPSPFWTAGQNTQARNLREGLKLVNKDDWLVIIEDDDHYSKDWLKVVSVHLEHSELIGEHRARYYNIQTKKCKQIGNMNHSSLCSTAMRGNAIVEFGKLCSNDVKFIDINLWNSVKRKTLFTGGRVTGIKGLPGRDGIGIGHKDEFQGMIDSDGSVLRQWIGDDAKEYL